MHKLYTAANLPEAYLVLELLRAAGIEAHVFNENAQGGLGQIPFTDAYPELWLVNEADVGRARQVVAEYERSADGAEVRCAACGEQNPSSFQICWHCGALL